jgi:hypothetical protein
MTDTRTPADIRREWIAALRSGKYRQGKTYLRNRDGSMCCLGVLHHVVTGMEPGFEVEGVGPPVCSKAGLSDRLGDFDGGCLALINDGGTSFSEIADIIESNPPGLFVDSKAVAS